MKLILAGLAGIFGIWLVFNLISAFIVGFIARSIFPMKDRIGWGTTLIVGFLGGIVGKVVFFCLGWSTKWLMGFVAAVVGGLLLLFLHHLMVASKGGASSRT